MENSKPKYNKRVPGPNFNEAWNKICEKSVERENTPDQVRAKAYSKDELKSDEEKWDSAGFSLLCRSHRREVDVDPSVLKELDRVAYYAEILSERAPSEWAEAVTLAKGLEKEIIANNAEIEAAPPTKATAADESKEVPAKIVRRPKKAKTQSKKQAATK